MAFTLRPYQSDAVEATIDYFRRHSSAAVIVLPTGAGKSLVIAELAKRAKGRVLVLAHVKELVAQNHEKYSSYGLEADIFSAGLAQKKSAAKVVFGSVQSVARHLDKFSDAFSLLIIDECHRISDDDKSQYHQVINHLKNNQPNLRILGLTATPYRLGKGWIYQYHYQGFIKGDEHCFFRDCIYELPLRYMIKHSYLVEPKRLDMPLVHYDFSALNATENGLYIASELNKAVKEQSRVTPIIVKQIIDYAAERQGVMIFAATLEHAAEIHQLLPQGESEIISGDTPGKIRDDIIKRFKNRDIRYLVNVSVLTTGFDAPHVDVIAILRPTESVSLYQQIVGRGLRLSPDKEDCLILDYAGNPHDLYVPEVGSHKPKGDSDPVQVFCPSCGFANLFWGKALPDGTVLEHFGRRCQGVLEDNEGNKAQCDFRFRFKLCPQCDAENDIAARVCQQCQHLIFDADDMLKAALKLKDALILRCGGMDLLSGKDEKGEWLKITYYDEDGSNVSEKYRLTTAAQRALFIRKFLSQHLRAPGCPFNWQDANDIIKQKSMLRHPDFVVARKQKHYWLIRDKVFNYQGRYRKAADLY